MFFDKFLLAVESHDPSQADIVRPRQEYHMSVFFPQLSDGYQNSKLYKKKLFGTWQFGKIDIFLQKFSTLKSLHFSQFVW